MKENIGTWVLTVCFFALVGLLVYKLYPVTTRTQYGFSVDVGKLIRDAEEKRRETLLIELGGIEYTREFEPEFFSALPHSGWYGEMDLNEEIASPAPIIKYKDGSEENCWFNIKTGEPEFFPEAPPAERMREFIPQDQESQDLYDKYIKEGKEPMAAAGSVLRDKILENLDNKK